MSRLLLIVVAILAHGILLAQSGFAQSVQGFVLNRDNKQRVAQVYVFNANSETGVFNNGRGEFTISAKRGDVLFAAREGYALDTIVYNGQAAIYFQLRPLAIQISQVDIQAQKLDPTAQYLKTRREYLYATEKGQVKDVFSLSNATVGISIDAIFALLSRQGKNARHLQRILEKNYKESLIDYRFKPDLVARTLNIKDPELTDFMQQYRPSYNFVLTATDYTFITFLKNSYASYKRNPDAYRLPPLPDLQ